MDNYMSWDDIYTSCPNCGSLADRWDIQNGNCSNCRHEQETE